jgi:hypothetical protein
MRNAIYSWQTAYRSAVLETSPTQLSIRINEARHSPEVGIVAAIPDPE